MIIHQPQKKSESTGGTLTILLPDGTTVVLTAEELRLLRGIQGKNR